MENKTRQLTQEIQSPTSVEQDKTIRTRKTITKIGRTRQDNQDMKYNHQNRQNKTRQLGQEIQSPTYGEQDKIIRARNTIINIGRTRQDN